MSQALPVVILAGGLGTRLNSVNFGLPKSMVSVCGKPFIAHQLNLLKKQGVSHVVLCVGHNAEPLIDFVGDGKQFGMTVEYSRDSDTFTTSELLGTGGALLKASKLVGSSFAVLYGDSWLDVDWMPILAAYSRSNKVALMTVYRNENRLIPSNLRIEGGLVTAYNKEHPSADMVHVDFGLSIFSEKALSGFHEQKTFDLSAVIKALIASSDLACYEVEQRFYEVGTPQAVKELEEHLLSMPA
ncbi:N/A [soil metagenome]